MTYLVFAKAVNWDRIIKVNSEPTRGEGRHGDHTWGQGEQPLGLRTAGVRDSGRAASEGAQVQDFSLSNPGSKFLLFEIAQFVALFC